jgi:hypothetical protein
MATGRPFTTLPQRLYVVVVRYHKTRKVRRRSDGLTHTAARDLVWVWKKLYCFDKVEIDGPFVKA